MLSSFGFVSFLFYAYFSSRQAISGQRGLRAQAQEKVGRAREAIFNDSFCDKKIYTQRFFFNVGLPQFHLHTA